MRPQQTRKFIGEKSMLNEAEIIKKLTTAFPTYIGDDAAVIKANGDQRYVLTKDLLLEDIHFRLAYHDPVHLAQKALQVNLSDLAAMGATPQFVLLGMSIPTSYENKISLFLDSFTDACKSAGVILIGGDTTKSPDKLFLSITAIGIADLQNIKYRHTAKPGDLIGVVGNLGHAHIGFTALENSMKGFESFKKSFLAPQALVKEGIFLGSNAYLHAMMDISDGLWIDLKRLCSASQVGAEINLDYLDDSAEFNKACAFLQLETISTQLTGGEDYCLLFTFPPEHQESLTKQFQTNFSRHLKIIGRITKETEVNFIQNGTPIELQLKAFSHFGE